MGRKKRNILRCSVFHGAIQVCFQPSFKVAGFGIIGRLLHKHVQQQRNSACKMITFYFTWLIYVAVAAVLLSPHVYCNVPYFSGFCYCRGQQLSRWCRLSCVAKPTKKQPLTQLPQAPTSCQIPLLLQPLHVIRVQGSSGCSPSVSVTGRIFLKLLRDV